MHITAHYTHGSLQQITRTQVRFDASPAADDLCKGFGLSVQMLLVSVNKTLLVQEPFPCNPAAELLSSH